MIESINNGPLLIVKVFFQSKENVNRNLFIKLQKIKASKNMKT